MEEEGIFNVSWYITIAFENESQYEDITENLRIEQVRKACGSLLWNHAIIYPLKVVV